MLVFSYLTSTAMILCGVKLFLGSYALRAGGVYFRVKRVNDVSGSHNHISVLMHLLDEASVRVLVYTCLCV